MIPRLSIILARARNGIVGREGGLPWKLSRDLKQFRELTIGKPVIMGRKTFASIGKPLPGRHNIIITRDHCFKAQGCDVVYDFEAAMDIAVAQAGKSGSDEIFVIGGPQIYRLALEKVQRIYLTEIELDAKGDVLMAPFDQDTWLEISRKRFEPEGDDSATFSFVVLDRRS